jgi:hypothetical protein
MGEVVTLLTSASGHSLVKSFSGQELSPQPFSTGKLFNVSEKPVSDLKSLSALLQRLEEDPTHTVIRGALEDGQSSPVPRKMEYFTAIPRQWCMIDIDSLTWDGDLSDQQAMLAYAIQQLPPEFQAADCWYHFSSSMGIKAGLNVHLWFWLERPCSNSELKAWLAVRWIWIGLNSRRSTGQPESQAFISSFEHDLSSQNHRCTLIPALMPILDEK